MAAPSTSATVALRSKGNAFYASAFTDGIDPLLRRSRLNIALSKYREALRRHVAESQPSADELSSLWKNVAMVSSALAACHADAYKAYKPPVMDAASSERVMVRAMRRAIEDNEWDYKQIEEHYKEAIKAFCLALLFGSCEARNTNTVNNRSPKAGAAAAASYRAAKSGAAGSSRGGGSRPARSAPAKPEEWQQKVLGSFTDMIFLIMAFAHAASSSSGGGGSSEMQPWRRDSSVPGPAAYAASAAGAGVRDNGERLLWVLMGAFGEMRARDSWKEHLGDKDPNSVNWTATSTRHVEAFAAFHVAFSQFLLDKGQSLLTINLARCSHSPSPTSAEGIRAGVNGITLGIGRKGPARLVVQRESARCFAECERPLRLLDDALMTLERNVAGRSCGNQSVTQATLTALRIQATDLQTTRFTGSCLCESVETLVRAMALCARAATATSAAAAGGRSANGGGLDSRAAADVALLWAAVDGFKEAVVLTRERHVDMEAYALSWLGHVYDVALQLVLSALQSHRTLALSPWYSASVRAIDRHQAKVRRQEEQRREQERGPLLAKLKLELETLSKMSESGWKQLLTHVYSKYPPKNGNGNYKCPSLNVDDAKVSLRTAILHYHPDKNGEHGDRWKILCEEVTKCLNSKYAVFTCA
ncbi:unnamed protein product [Closterium sp. Naga37s-1]|nr:unnamed protein product [Closterium sp. Naga37s-1]